MREALVAARELACKGRVLGVRVPVVLERVTAAKTLVAAGEVAVESAVHPLVMALDVLTVEAL